MATQNNTVVGVFENEQDSRDAIHELKRMGFTESEIGVVRPHTGEIETPDVTDAADESAAGTGALAGAATGVGLGALWGLGVLAGVLPAIGPAIAGGTLAALLSSAAAGAAAVGLAGTLIGMGIPREEAEYYESEMKSGRTIVTVQAGARREEARSILDRFGGYNMSSHGEVRRTEHLAGEATGYAGDALTGHRHDTGGAPTSPAGMGTTNKVQAREEHLRVEKTPVETGDVTLRKEVSTEHKTLDVPVTREEVVIERRPASGQAQGAVGGSQEIRIPVREEQVNVTKETVATEEVAVGKRKVQDTQHIDETLRKEEIKVEKHGDVNVKRT